MRLSRIFRAGGCALFICAPFVSSTVLTATMLTSFMGGFLMGKMTLGTFLMMMQGLNNGQQSNNPSKTRESTPQDSIVSTKMSDAENAIRDRFLRQLGEMDPLNCLPKVFCELNDPSKKETPLDDNEGDDDDTQGENSEEDDNSESEEGHDDLEGGDEEDELNERIKTRRKKQNLKLEADALDALVEESHDPMDYYFILKDKMKLRPKYKPHTASHPPFFPKKQFLKKRGQSNLSTRGNTDQSEYKAVQAGEKSHKNIDDIFADDPFFDDFARSMKFSPETVDYHRVGRQLRRIDATNRDFRRKFRVAATVGEKSAKSCEYVFNTCPFKATQIMAMVNTLKRKNAGQLIAQSTPSAINVPSETTSKVGNITTVEEKNANLQNLRNTLLAIESLNNVTLLAKTAGLPVSYNQILADVAENDNLEETGISYKILDDFNKETSNMTIPTSTKKKEKSKVASASAAQKSTKKRKVAASKKTKTGNKRVQRYRILRNNLSDRKGARISKRSLRRSRNAPTTSSSSSEESAENPQWEINPSAVMKLEIPESIPNSAGTAEQPNSESEPLMVQQTPPEETGRIYFTQAEFEDDEMIASEEDNLFIPEFSKFPPHKKRPKPRPHPPPQYQQSNEKYNRRRITTTTQAPTLRPPYSSPPGYNYNSESVLFINQKMRPRQPTTPTPPARKKLAHLIVEDDEADASEIDRAVEKIIATRHQIKVRPNYQRTSQ